MFLFINKKNKKKFFFGGVIYFKDITSTPAFIIVLFHITDVFPRNIHIIYNIFINKYVRYIENIHIYITSCIFYFPRIKYLFTPKYVYKYTI